MNRRIFFLGLAAVTVMLALLLLEQAHHRDSGWQIPRLAIGRDNGPKSTSSGADPGVEWGTVQCTVEAALGADPGQLIARGEGNEVGNSTASDRLLTLHLAPGDWRVDWHGGKELRRLGTVEVAAGETERCRIDAAGWRVGGNVRDQRGNAVEASRVEGCGAETETDEHGTFSLAVKQGDCLIRAWAVDGMLRRPSEPLYFSPFDPPGDPTIRVDTSEIGGVGLALSSGTAGLEVTLVEPGSPAEGAGLAEGDVIVAVNGEKSAGWSVVRGVENITGAPGTRVSLRILRDAAERDYELTRARIDPPVSGDTGR